MVRPVGTTFAVVAPQVLTVNVSLTVFLRCTAVSSQYVGNIQIQIADYLNGLAIGRLASVTRVAQCAYLAGQGVENVTGILLNEDATDVLPPSRTVIKAGTIVVTINDG
jgi:hypothetical protein